MYAVLDHIEEVTPTVRTFWFQPEQKVRYSAGQFTELYLPHKNPDDRGTRRWFTLSSSPTEELLAITTRLEPERPSSYKQQLAAFRPGARLHLADPMGDFVLPKDPTLPLVFVAAGLGITPVRSMIKWLYDLNEQRQIQLIYSVSQAEDLAFQSLFTAYHLLYTPIIVTQNGRLTTDKILGLGNITPQTLLYISGPELFVEQTYKELQQKGIGTDRLVGDYFPGYSL